MNEIRKIPYGKQTVCDEDISAVVEVLKSDYLTTGPKLKEFEAIIADYHKAKYAVAFANGTAALHGAYYAAGIKEGDEIITSPITFAASANGAVYLGAKPVLVDIDPNTCCININKIETGISKKTKVITPVSLAGYPVDLKAIRKIADRHGCLIIHDAAHAIGSRRNETFGMEYADMAILSFHPVKHVTTGEGGMVLTNSEELYKRLTLFRTHGITKNPEMLINCDGPWYYEMQDLGYNYRMSDINAALGIEQFKRIRQNLTRRNQIAKAYNEAFSNDERFIVPPDMGFGIIEDENAANIHSYHLYTLRLTNAGNRSRFFSYLHENGVMVQIHYIPLNYQPYYKEKFGYERGDYSQAEIYYNSEISLPMYHGMTDEDVQYVIDVVKAFE